jgi:glycosyltransferase involved in cell wall biosynthesis
MRVLFIIDTLTAGGKERRLTELIKGIREDTDFISELVVMSSDIHYREILDLGVIVHKVIRQTKKDLIIFFKLHRIFKDFNPDIVHCWDSMTAVYAIPLCRLLKIKVVNGMIADAPMALTCRNKDYFRARITFPFSDFVVGNSRAGLLAYHAPVHKSGVFYNGFNFDRIKKLEDKQDLIDRLNPGKSLLVGMIATFGASKDYKTYFKAAARILEEKMDVIFLAIGKETDSDEAKKLIDKRYSARIKCLGKRSDVESLINIMDICVLSTFTEGISNSILEYMALGKPVVATSGGGTSEIVIDDNTGFLTMQGDHEEMAEKIILLIRDADLREKMGQAGKDRIVKSFSIRQMTGKYITLYMRLTGKDN